MDRLLRHLRVVKNREGNEKEEMAGTGGSRAVTGLVENIVVSGILRLHLSER